MDRLSELEKAAAEAAAQREFDEKNRLENEKLRKRTEKKSAKRRRKKDRIMKAREDAKRAKRAAREGQASVTCAGKTDN